MSTSAGNGDGGASVPRRSQWSWRVLAIAAACLILIGSGTTVAVFKLTNLGSGQSEILREPSANSGPDPFTSNVGNAAPQASQAPAASPSPAPAQQGSQVQVPSTYRSTPGLYGGTQQIGTCNPHLMVDYLKQNPAKAAAWVQTLNSDPTFRWSGGSQVTVNQIDQYINELTSVVLRADTRVTNHGYRNGQPTSFPSVLQAGTAVLVDQYGVPRARCACGNPLTRPSPVPGHPRYIGTAWRSFSETTIIVVVPAPVVINNFVLVNVNNGTVFPQKVGAQYQTVPPNLVGTPGVPTPPTSTPPATGLPSSSPTPPATGLPSSSPTPPATGRGSATPSPPTSGPTGSATSGAGTSSDCTNPLSPAAAAALVHNQTGPYGPWVPDTSAYDPSLNLSVVRGDTPGGTGSSPVQIFLFHKGCYLSAALPGNYFHVEVSQAGSDTVELRFGHYQPTDPTAAPSLPPYLVRYQWNGIQAVPLDPLPPVGQGLPH